VPRLFGDYATLDLIYQRDRAPVIEYVVSTAKQAPNFRTDSHLLLLRDHQPTRLLHVFRLVLFSQWQYSPHMKSLHSECFRASL